MRRDVAALTLVLSALVLAVPHSSPAGDEKAAPVAASPATIAVSFKLDPRLSGPTYGGERWVSPPTYTGAAAQDTVEARAFAVDAQGRSTKVDAVWSASDPELLTVSPPRGDQVKITAKRVGQSNVTVTSGAASTKLIVKTVQKNGIRQVSISR